MTLTLFAEYCTIFGCIFTVSGGIFSIFKFGFKILAEIEQLKLTIKHEQTSIMYRLETLEEKVKKKEEQPSYANRS
jgi:hypothetical protein